MQDIVVDKSKAFYKNGAKRVHSPMQYHPYQKIVTFYDWVAPDHYILKAALSMYV